MYENSELYRRERPANSSLAGMFALSGKSFRTPRCIACLHWKSSVVCGGSFSRRTINVDDLDHRVVEFSRVHELQARHLAGVPSVLAPSNHARTADESDAFAHRYGAQSYPRRPDQKDLLDTATKTNRIHNRRQGRLDMFNTARTPRNFLKLRQRVNAVRCAIACRRSASMT